MNVCQNASESVSCLYHQNLQPKQIGHIMTARHLGTVQTSCTFSKVIKLYEISKHMKQQTYTHNSEGLRINNSTM
jgi:hypothetical protein